VRACGECPPLTWCMTLQLGVVLVGSGGPWRPALLLMLLLVDRSSAAARQLRRTARAARAGRCGPRGPS
jgi:hypothetical protein